MNILVCCKIVPEEQDISINSDRTVNLGKAEWKISQYDLNAVEAGVELAAAVGESTVVALSAGDRKSTENSKVRKDILSRGPDSLVLVSDDSLAGALPDRTAEALAGAAKKLGFDLILCGEGSGDLYAQQTGILLGEKLGVPCLNAVSGISVDGGAARVERSLEDEVEVLAFPLPAVLMVTTDINTPRIPGMKAILAAGKKPVTIYSAQDAGCGEAPPLSVARSVLAPERLDRLGNVMEGDSDENIAAFAENVRKALQ
jgi:electron transfer flavoprotein beta subunit